MLSHLSIRDLVLIERVDIDLSPGLMVLTGETGAGKSILLDGLGLALGGRAEAAMVRPGAQQAAVAAEFRVAPDHPATAYLHDGGVETEEPGAILIRRLVKADGGSRAFVNDQPVSATLLRGLGALLVEIHGQHDERGLLNPRGHMALLDLYAGHDGLVAAMAAAWAGLAGARRALEEAEARAAADERDREWLEHAAAELRALAPQAGEEAELADMRSRMQKSARLTETLDQVYDLLSSADGALSRLRQAARRLERLGESEPEFQQALDALDRALVEGDAVETALATVRDRASVTPEELEEAETRLFDLRAMARKHRIDVEALPGLAESLDARLAALADMGGAIRRLKADVQAAETAVAAAATALGRSRRAAAERLDRSVNAELPALKLETARFRTTIADADPGPTGADRVSFEIATNRGRDFGPLTRIASGGELSRFILALRVALASAGTAGTLIFDEIDRGVGGAVASAIGERLARLSHGDAGTQLLVVTHSPQVAAAGSTHFLIAKRDAGEGTRTSVRPLPDAERVEEVARMLSGAEITPEARAQAEKLIG